MADGDRWEQRYRRERAARHEAERIAEAAIGEMQAANQQLDQRVVERTAELAAALQRVEEADRAKSTFLHGLAHELSTPLHGIAGLVELVRERTADPDLRSASLQIERAASRLQQALRSLVELAAMSSGKAGIDAVDLRLGDVADRLTDRWQPQAAARGLLLVVDVDPGFDALIQTDPTRLDQILDALLDNAIRYGAGRVTVGLHVAVDADTAALEVRVSDEGPGFPDDLRARAFDAFVRGDEVSDSFGVGLTLARAVTEHLGGTIELLPTTVGAEVRVTIPLPPRT